MDDHLTQLEERVENLIQRLERSLQANEELARQNAELKSEIERLGVAHARLEEHLRAQEEKLTTCGGREEAVREHLQRILGRLDAITQEATAGRAAE